MYPLLLDGVKLGTYENDEGEDDGFFAENARGETFDIGDQIYDLLLIADGCHDFYKQGLPRREVTRIIRDLKKCRLISTSHLQLGFPFGRLVLFVVGDQSRAFRGPCTAFNQLLPYLCLFLSAAGAFSLGHAFSRFSLRYPPIPYLLMILVSIFLHELGHFCAAIAYRCKVADVGILLVGILPVGAYVSQSEIHHRARRTQIALAGIEMNLCIAGLCALLSRLPGDAGWTFATACVWNLFLAVSNLLPTSGLDGDTALSSLLGIPSFSDFALSALRNPRSRRMLLHGGAEGLFWLGVCLFQILCRLLLVLTFVGCLLLGLYMG